MTASVRCSNGALAVALIDTQVRALVDWHAPVLANRDPEALHQMRVTMRRLRVTLDQFEPVIRLPVDLKLSRLAKTSRRLGLARDLDVLESRLQRKLLPQLPASEVEQLRPVLKQLKRERQQAQGQLAEQLKGGAYLGWLAQMQAWLRRPGLTPWADQPLADDLLQWQLGWISTLFVHPAWSIEQLHKESQREQLHDLRKQIKRARYQLENCRPLLGRGSRQWQRWFKQMQEQLGELNDLQVLHRAINDQHHGSPDQDLPRLQEVLQQQESQCWQSWRVLAAAHGGPGQAPQVLARLQQDRRRAQLQRRALLLCSAIQRTVFCDWRGSLASR